MPHKQWPSLDEATQEDRLTVTLWGHVCSLQVRTVSVIRGQKGRGILFEQVTVWIADSQPEWVATQPSGYSESKG